MGTILLEGSDAWDGRGGLLIKSSESFQIGSSADNDRRRSEIMDLNLQIEGPELRDDFILRMKDIDREKSIPVEDFGERYNHKSQTIPGN